MTAPPPQAVVFDLDDTLFLERDYVRSGFRAVSEHLRRAMGRGDDFAGWMWAEFLAGRRERVFDRLVEHFGLGLGAMLPRCPRKHVFRRPPAGGHASANDAAWHPAVGELVEVYRNHRPKISPCPGVVEVLDALRRAGWRVGLLTDGFLPAQQYKVDALGLAGRFDAIVFTESLGRDAWKPSPRGFERMEEMLGVPPEACAYVADNPAKDFVAGNRRGWMTLQWRREGQVHADNPAPPGGEPQHVVRTDAELLDALGVSRSSPSK